MSRKPYKDWDEVRRDTFAMRLNVKERRMLMALARRLQRSRSDTVRLLVREAVRELIHASEEPDVAEATDTTCQEEQNEQC